MTTEKTTISVTNTPVQRALAKAKRSTLVILFVAGILVAFVYKNYFKDQPAETPAQTSQQQR
ncbi:hypothetical protein LJC26_07520 [Desulfovibrio sp. OttesenSCG-928-O18]|nr:hypothetical protein [Desulfovibrio sp. OttesenSCG-928-O18]